MIGAIMGLVAGIGVDTVITTAVKTITPVAASTFTKVASRVGIVAVSGLAAKGVGDIIDEKAADFKAKVEQKKQELEQKRQTKQEVGA